MEIKKYTTSQTLTYLNSLQLDNKKDNKILYSKEFIQNLLEFLDYNDYILDETSLNFHANFNYLLEKTNEFIITGKYKYPEDSSFHLRINEQGILYLENIIKDNKFISSKNPIHLSIKIDSNKQSSYAKICDIFKNYDISDKKQENYNLINEKLFKVELQNKIQKAEEKKDFISVIPFITEYMTYLHNHGYNSIEIIDTILKGIEISLSNEFKTKELQNQSLQFEQDNLGWRIGVNREILSFHNDDCMFYRRSESYSLIDSLECIPWLEHIESNLLKIPTRETIAIEKDLHIYDTYISIDEKLVDFYFYQPDLCLTSKNILPKYKENDIDYKFIMDNLKSKDIPIFIRYDISKDKWKIYYDTTMVSDMIAKSLGINPKGIYEVKWIDDNEKDFLIQKVTEYFHNKYEKTIVDFFEEMEIERE